MKRGSESGEEDGELVDEAAPAPKRSKHTPIVFNDADARHASAIFASGSNLPAPPRDSRDGSKQAVLGSDEEPEGARFPSSIIRPTARVHDLVIIKLESHTHSSQSLR